jgi:predicted AlkP superfamily phosphohydrolase/phosphomutase
LGRPVDVLFPRQVLSMISSAARRPLAVAGALAAALALSLPLVDCRKGPEGGKPLRRSKERVFVIGFDGMDPTLARKWMDEGKLPNLKALAEEGVFARLGSTQPSESPTAWSSFATGVNPGKHSIYDFLVRDLATYFPDFNMIRKEPPKFLWGLIPTQKPKVFSTRGGTSFWKTASADGIESVVLTVPVTFPPEEMHHGAMLVCDTPAVVMANRAVQEAYLGEEL